MNKKAEALKDLDKVILINPNQPEAYYKIGIINIDDNPSSAVKDLSKYIEYKPA